MRRLDGHSEHALVVAFVTACCFSCAAETYHGQHRAANEVAKLVTTSAQDVSGYSTDIVSIDGNAVSGSSFKLLPGRHSVEAEGTNTPRGNTGAVVGAALFSPAAAILVDIATKGDDAHSGRLMACFIARPDRTYEVRTFGEGGLWKIEVVDQETTYDVKSPCKAHR